MPTVRQQKVVEKLLENTGQNMGDVLREVGYGEGTAVNPQQVTNSKGFKELMEKYLPDSLLAEKHKELLTVPKKIKHFKKGEIESEIEELDSAAISKGLDMAYKIKGLYAPDKMINLNVDVNPTLSDEDKKLLEIIREHDRNTGNTSTEVVEDTGNISDGVDEES